MMLLRNPHHFPGAAIDKNEQESQYYVCIDCLYGHYLMWLLFHYHLTQYSLVPAHLYETKTVIVDLVAAEQQFRHYLMVTCIQPMSYSLLVEIQLNQLHFPRCLIAFSLVLTALDAIVHTVAGDVIDAVGYMVIRIERVRIIWFVLDENCDLMLHVNYAHVVEAKIVPDVRRMQTMMMKTMNFVRMIEVAVH